MEVKLDKNNVEDIIALTPLQEGLLFLYLSESGSVKYFEQLVLHLEGEVDPECFMKAWQYVSDANEMLRTVYRWENIEKPVQIILKSHSIPIKTYDFSALGKDEREKAFDKVKRQDKCDRIDIRLAPMRIILAKMEPGKYRMLISNYHIIFDGWSYGIILKEFFDAYHQYAVGNAPVRITKTPYKKYVTWCKQVNREAQAQFWKKYLQGLDTRTELPVQTRVVKEEGHGGEAFRSYRLSFGRELTERIADFTRKNAVTLASLLYAVWGLLLQKYNNINDVVFGTTISGRNPEISGMQDMVGLFINTLPLRVKCEPDQNILAMIRSVSGALEQREEYGVISPGELKKCFEYDIYERLFDSIMVIKNYPLDEKLKSGYEKLKVQAFSMQETTNFDLTLQVFTFEDITIDFNFNGNLLQEKMIQRISGHFLNTVTEVLEKPEEKVSALEIIPADERSSILEAFNQAGVTYPGNKLIHEIFEEQAARNPDKIAARYGSSDITYGSLNRKANQLADMLKKQGIGAGTVIGLLIPRSIEMVIGLLAIFKSNAVCAPLDIRHPAARTGFILEDSAAGCLLILEEHPCMDAFKGKVIKMDLEETESYPDANPVNTIRPESPAYLIYTSGSTGKPKGVVLHHRGVINHIYTKIDVLEMNESDIVGNNFSINVVAAIWQILSPLLVGGTLRIYPEEVEKDPYLQFEMVSIDSVSIIEIIPSVLKAYIGLLRKGRPVMPLPALRRVALTSEETKPSVVKEYFQYYQIPLVNCYGQTECSDDTLHYTIYGYEEGLETVPIGKPSNNTRAYIMDRNFKLQPPGIKGELCISGDGLSVGYLNRPELTAEKFVPNPLERGTVMYRTGDLARWREDGIVECFGRLDHQVKIRGNRIETGEIESKLLSHKAIREAAVVTREDSGESKYLCAYFSADRKLTVTELREFLRNELPEYMLPAGFIQLDHMPLTPNGKIDRKALPEDAERIETGKEYTLPEDKVEWQLLNIWKEILEKERISTSESFFDLGGNSIMMVQMLAEVSDLYPGAVTMPDLFTYPTIAQLAAFVRSKAAQEPDSPVVTYIRLPGEYGSNDRSEGSGHTYQYTFRNDEINRLIHILNAEQATLYTVLPSMLAFVLSKATGEKKIPIQCLDPDTGVVATVEYDFTLSGDAANFIRNGARNCLEAFNKSRYLLHNYKTLPGNREPGSILPLFCKKGEAMPVWLTDIFNLVVGCKEKDGRCELSWEYHGREFIPEKMEALFRGTIEFIYFFIENYLLKES